METCLRSSLRISSPIQTLYGTDQQFMTEQQAEIDIRHISKHTMLTDLPN